MKTSDREIAWAKIVSRAASDDDFCLRARNSPADVFEEYGVSISNDCDPNKDIPPRLDAAVAEYKKAGGSVMLLNLAGG
jgi:hypothetical protein